MTEMARIAPEEDIGASRPRLFEPLTLRGLILKNRVAVSPMAMYSSHEGFSTDFHLVHLGRFALGGAGLIMTEATSVTRQGRITPGCNGLWLDAQVGNLRRIADFIHQHDAAFGIQLGHSGRKGSARRPWHGGAPLSDEDQNERREQPWPAVSADNEPFDENWPRPHMLGERDLDELVRDFRSATRRSVVADFDVVELHCAHGYLLHSFLSPLANARGDSYGGSLENRMRFPLRVVEAVREEWPHDRPLFVRISSVDGIDFGWQLEDSVAFSSELRKRGVDIVDCSSGGMKLPRDRQLVSREPGFQVPFAAEIRRRADIGTMAVGLIRTAKEAEAILERGEADLIAMAREVLVNPNWTAQAAVELMPDKGWEAWPTPFRGWLQRRARIFQHRKS